MTRDEIMQLDDDALRIAVARALGYRWYRYENVIRNEAYLALPSRTGIIPKGYVESAAPSDGDEVHAKTPDYPRDIRAAYELEDALPVERRDDYTICLHDVILRRQGVWKYWDMAHASASDRARAWLLTMEE